MGTAVIVTRASAEEDMGEQIGVQLFKDPRALTITASLIGLLGLVPGMPNLVFLTLGAGLGLFAWRSSRNESQPQPEVEKVDATPEVTELSWDDVRPTDILGLDCLLYTSPSPRDRQKSRMPSSA